MESSSPAGALSSPHVNSAEPGHSRAKRKKVSKKEDTDSSDIDAKTFAEAEANIKALAEEAEPKLAIKPDGTAAADEHTANGVIETDTSFTEFEFLTPDGEADEDADDVDPEAVLDRIFDAAKSGNSADFSRLLFVKSGTPDVKRPASSASKRISKEHKVLNKAFVEHLLSKGRTRSQKRKSENDHSVADNLKTDVEIKPVSFKNVKNTTKPEAEPVVVPEPKTVTEPKPAVQESKPECTTAVKKPKSAVKKPKKPAVKEPKEVVQESEPSVQEPKPAVQEPNPAVQELKQPVPVVPKPAVPEPKPAVPEPKAAVSNNKPAVTKNKPSVPVVGLIDYSVLTSALTKTLQDSLNGDDNDVKIVIFCNNKPIQSFSLRNNVNELAAKIEETKPPKLIETASTKVEKVNTTKVQETKVEKVNATKVQETKVDKFNTTKVQETNSTKVDKVNAAEKNIPETSNTCNSFSEQSSPNAEEKRKPVEKAGKVQAESPQKLGFKRLSSGKKKNVNSNTFLRIKGSHISNINKYLSQETSANAESDDDTGKLVINTDTANTDVANTDVANTDAANTDATNTDATNTDSAKEAEADASKNEVIVDDLPQFQCEICLKRFNLRRTLNRHKLRVHTSTSYQTPHPIQPSESVSVLTNQETKTVSLLTSLEQLSPPAVLPEQALDASGELEVNEDNLEETTNSNEECNDLGDVDLSRVKIESASGVPIGGKEGSVEYIQSLLAKGPLFDILQSQNTSHSTKVSTLRSVIQQVENASSSKRIDLPIDSNGDIQPVFVCEHCGKYYRSRKTLKDHFLREHAKELGEEPLYLYIAGNKYQCTLCFKYFHSASELLSHTKTHTGELLSPCNICGKVYASVHVLRRHIDNVHADARPRPFRCQLCDYAASNKWHLKEHHRRHTGEQPFCCPICRKSFSHQGTMNRHCKTVHRFDSSSLSREQLKLQHSLTNLTVNSLELSSSDLTLADLTAPIHLTTESIIKSIPLVTASDSRTDSGIPALSGASNQTTEQIVNQITEQIAEQIADLEAQQAGLEEGEEEEYPDTPETAGDPDHMDDSGMDIDMSIVKTEPLETF